MNQARRSPVVCALAALALLSLAAPVAAQGCTEGSAGAGVLSSPRGRLLSAMLTLAAAGVDARMRDLAVRNQRPGLDRIANAVDPLGRAGVLVPALAASVLVPRLLGNRGLADHATRVALSYVAADAVESVLKPAVGRHRPSDGGGPWRFRPFQNDADWHSFPSAHTVHIVSLATAIAGESDSRWISGPVWGVAGAVGMERVYVNAHWTSDVVASAVLASAVSGATDHWLRGRGIAHVVRPAEPCR